MECLNLPQELIWDGKMEPSSPSSELFSLSNTGESWLLEDNFAKDILLLHDEEYQEISEDSIINEELLCEFEYDIKQEQWIDGKYGVPQYIDCSSGIMSPQPTPIMKVQNPCDIVMEFETFYDDVELTQLTPPQTPPQQSIPSKDFFDMMISRQQTQPIMDISSLTDDMLAAMSPSNSSGGYSSDSTCPSATSDIAVQIVDEILRTRAKDLPVWTNEDDNDSLYSTSSSSSVSQSTGEFTFKSLPSDSSPTSGKISKSGVNSSKRRPRPYGRAAEDKKSRKKEQNKNAATRYRQKKKEEMKEILDEERQLLQINENLLKTQAEYKREVNYLKKLIKEFHQK